MLVYDDQLFSFYIRDMRACSVASVTSNSLQSCGLKPTRLLCPWDSPGKNTGVSGLPFPPPGDLRDSGIEPESLESPALAGGFFPTEPPGKHVQFSR